MNTTCKSSLRILQWNAEAVSTKMFELSKRLVDDDIDICVVQESHLVEGKKLPSVDGYKLVRADRVVTKGGGLVAFVKKSLNGEEIDNVSLEATEVSTFRVRMHKGKWIHISHVYIPPTNSKGQESIKLRTDAIPALKSSLICGDFNGHSVLWDSHVDPDARGEEIVEWMFDQNLTVLNNGDATRINRDTGNVSTPDVTLCGTDWMGKTEWYVTDPIGSSDHLPILITVNCDVKHQSVYGKRSKWRSNGVDWEKFRLEIDENMGGLEEMPLMSRIIKFNSAVIDSAKIHVR